MRCVVAVLLAGLFPLSAAAQVAPAGWADLLGKSCSTRSARTSMAARFNQGKDGPFVELTSGTSKSNKVAFTPPGGMTFDALLNGGQYVFLYNAKDKTWSGNLGGIPAFLTCSP